MESFLTRKKSSIVGRWRELIIDTYPPDAARFFKSEKDAFANPVGSTVTREIETIYDALLSGEKEQELSASLDAIVRMRAVQEFTPSEAVGFVFFLKRAVREELKKEDPDPALEEAVLDFEAAVDRLALKAFEIYTGCREQIHRIRANELKRRTAKLTERLGLGAEPLERGSQGCD